MKAVTEFFFRQKCLVQHSLKHIIGSNIRDKIDRKSKIAVQITLKNQSAGAL